MGVVHCFCFGLQKYEKTSVGGVIEVLHHVSMAEEEIEHQCAALECTSTLTDFTEAMIEGRSIRLTHTCLNIIQFCFTPLLRPVQERIRIHQTINKLIEQTEVYFHLFSIIIEIFMSSCVDDFLKCSSCL